MKSPHKKSLLKKVLLEQGKLKKPILTEQDTDSCIGIKAVTCDNCADNSQLIGGGSYTSTSCVTIEGEPASPDNIGDVITLGTDADTGTYTFRQITEVFEQTNPEYIDSTLDFEAISPELDSLENTSYLKEISCIDVYELGLSPENDCGGEDDEDESGETTIYGCMDPNALNYDPNATSWGDPSGTMVDDTTENYQGIAYGPFVCQYNYSCDTFDEWAGVLWELANINMEVYGVQFPDIDDSVNPDQGPVSQEEMGDFLCDFICPTAVDINPGQYCPACFNGFEFDPPAGSGIGVGICECCDEENIPEGCTDPEATNYDSYAGTDDGSCEYDAPDCPEGTTLNPETGECEEDEIDCPEGTTLNPETGECEEDEEDDGWDGDTSELMSCCELAAIPGNAYPQLTYVGNNYLSALLVSGCTADLNEPWGSICEEAPYTNPAEYLELFDGYPSTTGINISNFCEVCANLDAYPPTEGNYWLALPYCLCCEEINYDTDPNSTSIQDVMEACGGGDEACEQFNNLDEVNQQEACNIYNEWNVFNPDTGLGWDIATLEDFAEITDNGNCCPEDRHECNAQGICVPNPDGEFISLGACEASDCGPDDEEDICESIFDTFDEETQNAICGPEGCLNPANEGIDMPICECCPKSLECNEEILEAYAQENYNMGTFEFCSKCDSGSITDEYCECCNVSYTCIPNPDSETGFMCVEDEEGPYSSKTECMQAAIDGECPSVGVNYSCLAGWGANAGNAICAEVEDGEFTSLAECEASGCGSCAGGPISQLTPLMQNQCCHHIEFDSFYVMYPPFFQANYPNDWTVPGWPCIGVTSECCDELGIEGSPGLDDEDTTITPIRDVPGQIGGTPGGISTLDPNKRLKKPLRLKESLIKRLQKRAGIKKK